MYNVFARFPVKAYQNVCRFISMGGVPAARRQEEGSSLQAIFGHTLHSVCRSFQSLLFQEFQMRIQWSPISMPVFVNAVVMGCFEYLLTSLKNYNI